MARQVVVVGAGITGLVAARELLRAGDDVRVFERWPDVGGQASAFEVRDDVWLERYYHHLFESDTEMIALHDELLPGQLEWYPSTVAMHTGERSWPFVSPLDLLRYGPLPLQDRIRLGVATLRLVRTEAGDDERPAIDWLLRACGARAVDAVWRPMLFGKFGDDAERVPLAWLRSKLVLRRQHLSGRGAARELLGYPRGSFRAIAVALADDIRRHGGHIEVDREVVRIERRPDGFVVRCAREGAYRSGSAPDAEPAREARADVVLVTIGGRRLRDLAAWPSSYAEQIDAHRYRTAVVLLLELREPFGRAYWTNIVDPTAPFLALIEHTNLVGAERYGAHYLYVSNYVAPEHESARMTTEELLGSYMGTLERMRPGFRAILMRSWSFREELAQPIPRLDTRRHLLPFATPIPGLFVANTSQIYPEDRGTNFSVRLGRDVARRISPSASAAHA